MQILLVEDDLDDALYTEHLLCDHTIERHATFPAIDKDLSSFDFLILDYFISGESSLNYLNQLKDSHDNLPPIIVISGKIDEVPLNDIPENLNALVLSKNENFKELLFYYINLLQKNKPLTESEQSHLKLDYKLFLYQIVHDLRNDLGLAIGYNNLVAQFNDVKEELEYLRMLQKSYLFAFERLDMFTEFIKEENVCFVSVSEALDPLRQAHFMRVLGERINLHGDASQPVEHIPQYFLTAILKNLLENIYKHASTNKDLRVDIYATIKQGRFDLVVSDNGPGMDREDFQNAI